MKRVLVLLAVFVLLAAADLSHHHRRREVLLRQGRSIDTRSALRAAKDATHQKVAAMFDQSTEHQYIVHIAGPITDAKKQAIESAANVKLLHYIPHNSFIVAARTDQLSTLESAPGVLWVGAFNPEYKMPMQLADWENNQLPGASGTEMYVMLHSKLSLDALRSQLGQWAHELRRETGITAQFKIIRGNKLQVRVPEIKYFSKTANWLAHRPLVHWIEASQSYQTHAYDGGTGLIESNNTDHATILAAAGFTGGAITSPIPVSGEVIAVGDSGIDYQSCFFDGPGASPPPDGTSPPDGNRKVIKYVTTYADGVDFTGHGTAVCGAIAGNTSLPGFSDYNGLTPNAKLYVIDLGLGAGIKPPPDIVAFLHTPLQEGTTVSVNAFGTLTPPDWYTLTSQEVDEFLVQETDYVVIFSAGNSGSNGTGTICDPGIAKNVITVGGTQNDLDSLLDVDDPTLQQRAAADPGLFGTETLAPWSSRGPTPDGRIKPDIVAPSWYVMAASPNTQDTCVVNASYGASIGAGLVASASAIIRQYFKGGWSDTGAADPNQGVPEPSSALVKAVLINSGVGVTGLTLASGQYLTYSGSVPNDAYGFGRPILMNTLYIKDVAGSLSSYQDLDVGIGTGETVRSCISVTDSTKPLKATLVWTDYPGSPAAGIALVNNLDLVVMDQNGVLYRGNQDYGTNSGFDAINNVEQVTINNPAPGLYVVYVFGYNVPTAIKKETVSSQITKQPYALVISGNFDSGAQCPAFCPAGCSPPFGTCVNQGESCACVNGSSGIDCSILACPNNCTSLDGYQNGYCDVESGTCICSPRWMGPDCRTPFEPQLPDVIRKYTGLPAWQVILIAIFAFVVGGLLCCLFGWFLGLRHIGDSHGDSSL